jgi:ferric-dicitrate binding protein FerR (iron transport regulator)
MNLRRLPTSAFAAALLLAAAGAPDRAEAQREGYTYLSYAQPDVLLVSSAEDDVAARVNMPVLSGDSLVTGVGSRAEAVLADGNVVRVDGYSELRFERMARTYEAEDDRDLLFLAHGTAAVEVRDVATRDRALRFDTDDATILAASRGLFRVDAGRRGTEIYVLSGKVEVQGRGGRALVRVGEYAYVSGDSEIEVDVSASPRDRFARFVEERRDRTDRRETTRYVSSDFTYDYDTASFDDYGSWIYVSKYGTYCWKPRVPAGWTPYALGYWRWTPAGMTWVSAEPWGWLPYHYGTWVYDAFLGWLWVPGVEYSPAWVYWNYTPEWVGWCPIGYYSTYYRHARAVVGGPSPLIYPHLRGHVAVGQIDPRGWHYVAARRLGVRLDPERDIVRGDRVSFRPGEIGVIATAPLRFERGTSSAASIQEAIRRIPITQSGTLPASVNEGLTAVLRRDRTLTPAAQDELRRTAVRAGQDPAYRQTPLESPRGAEKSASADSWRQGVDRGPARGASASESPVRPGESSSASHERGASRRRGDEGWRSPSSPPPAPIQRRTEDRPGRHDDSGWRAPQPRVIERDRAHDAPLPREAPVHEAPRAAPQSAPAPAPQPAPAPPPARRDGAFRTFDGAAQGAQLRRA